MAPRHPSAKLITLVTLALASLAGPAWVQEVIYEQDFDGLEDGALDLGDGSVIVGCVVENGRLLLTEEAPAQHGAFWIPPSPLSTDGWIAEFDYSIENSGGSLPADGFSFNYGVVEAGEVAPQAEEGFQVQPNISFEIDTWLLGTPEVGPAIAVNGIDVPGGFTNGPILEREQSIAGTISIKLDQDGVATFTSTGAITNALFFDLPTGYALDAGYAFAIAARTGGAFQRVTIDNLRIVSAFLPPPATSLKPIRSVEFDPEAGRVELVLPTATRRQIGVEYSPDLSPGSWVELGNFFEDEEDPEVSRFVDPDSVRAGRVAGYYRAFLRPFAGGN